MRISSKLVLLLAVLLMAGVPALAASDSATAPHVQVSLIHDEFGVFAPDEILAGLYFKLEPGWHVYWMNPGDAGQPPKIDWTLPKGVKAGPLQYPAPKRLPLGPLMDFGYEGEVAFPVMLSVDSTFRPGSTVHVAAKVSWLVCRETCIPEKANLALDVPVVAAKPGGNGAVIPILQSAWAALPKPLPAGDKLGFVSTADGLRLTVETGQRETHAEFFPADQDVIDNPAPQKVTPTGKGFTMELKKDASLAKAPAQLRGLIELSGGRAFEIAAPQGAPVGVPAASASGAEGVSASAAASAGTEATAGANANPSASPAGTSADARTAPGLAKIVGLAFLGGILLNLMPCVFPVLFLKGLALVNSGSQERHKLRAHGLVYTLGIVVSFWALVGVLLALRAAGSRLGWGFQFQSPVFLFLMAGLLFFLGLSLAGQFEMGLSLTSTGGSLAAKHDYTSSFFTGVLAVIVATPCTAPFMGAAIGYALAAPAVATFAVFTALALGLAAPYLALTLQPAWTRILPRPGAWMEVLRQAVSVPIFCTAIWLAWVIANSYGAAMLAALLVGFLLLAIAGWFLGRWPAKGWSAVLAGLIVLCVVGLGVYSAQALAATPQMRAAAGHEGVWEPWSAETVARYQAQGRPVFVDFTASWCLSCQVNERVALTRPEVKKAFADANVALLKADWTQHDDAITDTLAKLGRSGVPVYALYTPGQSSPRLLPEALTPGIVMDALAQLPRASAQLNTSPSH